MQMNPSTLTDIARVNGVALHSDDALLSSSDLRQRAYSELLRQEAMKEGLLSSNDLPSPDGVMSEEATNAIEALIEKTLTVPEPSEEACRRHHSANPALYSTGERVKARHILFAVTQGVDVGALRNRAEATLLDVRCHDGVDSDVRFINAASTLSNCPSGAEGGNLGWLTSAQCAPEFAKEIFGHTEVGVLPRLVHSRFGFHVVEVLERELGLEHAFETVRGAVTMSLRQKSYVTALRQHLRLLAGNAVIKGIEIDSTEALLVQ